MDWGGSAGSNLPVLTARLGEIEAERARQNGLIWGQTLASIGSNIGTTIAQAPQRQLQQQEIAARTAELQGLAQDRQMKAQALQREQQGAAALAKAISNPANNGDPQLIYHEAAQVDPVMADKYLTQATTHAEALQKLRAAKDTERDSVAEVFAGVDPTDTAGIQASLGLLHHNGYDVSEQAQWFDTLGPAAALKKIHDSAPKNVAAAGTRAEKAAEEEAKAANQITVGPPGSSIFKGGQQIATVPEKAAPEPSLQQKDVFLDGKTPAVVNYNPKTGKSTLPATGEDVSDRIRPMPPASVTYPKPPKSADEQAADDVKETVKGMKDGSLPPVMPARGSKEYLALMAEAHRQGFNVSEANLDWAATQKHIATLNGAQQTKLNQSINALPELLDSVEGLAKQWQAGKFPILNKANLALAKNGVYGSQAATIANRLDAQIADVNADLAAVYMGGNSPTDHGLELAIKALSSDWDQTVLLNMVKQARENVRIRQNSIRNTGVQGASDTNPYVPKSGSTGTGDPLGIR